MKGGRTDPRGSEVRYHYLRPAGVSILKHSRTRRLIARGNKVKMKAEPE